jgi:RNA polymerase sigma-70 factor, ECF subfamily
VTGPDDISLGGPGATSLGLLDRARANDAAAWGRLTRLYEPLVDHWCAAAGLQPADAADVRQEVFLAVARRVGEFRRGPDGGSFRGWLRVITRTKVADHWRRLAGDRGAGGTTALERLRELPADAPPDGDAPALAEELRVLHRRALDLLEATVEPRTWRAFRGVVVDGRPPADVAAEEGLTVNAVYLAKARVLARLRAEFADLLDP